MKAIINPSKAIFRNKEAQERFDKIKSNSDVYECGIDTNGLIYWALLNGIVVRESRREFIKNAKIAEEESIDYQEWIERNL